MHKLTICKLTLTKTRVAITNVTTIGIFPGKCHVLDIRATENIKATSVDGCNYNFNSISIHTKL